MAKEHFNAGLWPHLIAYSAAVGLYLAATWAPNIATSGIWVGCMWCSEPAGPRGSVTAVLVALWLLHFLRRIYETVALFSFQRVRSPSELFAFLWYGGWAFWMGLSNNDAALLPSWPQLVVGLVVFLSGEAGNAICHYMMVKQRLEAATLLAGNNGPSSSGHIIPRGFAFEWLVAPHYTFEFIAWLGWFIACGSIASLLFAVVSFAAMAPRAREADRRYSDEFGLQYTSLRRSIFFPYLW